MGDNHQIILRQHQGLVCGGDAHQAVTAMGEMKSGDVLVGGYLHIPRRREGRPKVQCALDREPRESIAEQIQYGLLVSEKSAIVHGSVRSECFYELSAIHSSKQ